MTAMASFPVSEGGGAGAKRRVEKTPEEIAIANKMRRVEHEAQERVQERVRQVVLREFGSSLRQKEEEEEEIDRRLLQIQKYLHLVRYAAVTNYYSGSLIKQTRSQPDEVCLHPATRSLVSGKRPSTSPYAKPRSKSHLLEGTSVKIEPLVEAEAEKTEKIPCYVPPKPSSNLPQLSEPRGLQHKEKRRFIVGNVSKWIECDQREDQSTHKWMIYVRGDRDTPDVSDVVSKVRFLIHPSYHPHDLIEVTAPPFHLTRRGWGEFPARIQIHFKGERDKPIDVIHHLKLDRTYTGLQTLGSETVVDVWLHNPNVIDKDAMEDAKSDPMSSKAIIDHLKNPPDGWVIPHESEDILPESFLETMQVPVESSEDAAEQKACFEHETVQNGFLAESGKVTVKSETEDDTLQENGASSEQVNGIETTNFLKYTDKKGKTMFLPFTVLPRSQKQGTTSPNMLGEKASMKPSPLVPKTKSNGIKISLTHDVKPRNTERSWQHPVRSGGFLSQSCKTWSSSASTATSGISLLKAASPGILPPGASLLKKNATKSNSVSNGTTTATASEMVTVSFTSELEKVNPDIDLSTWNAILGRGGDETQLEVESRLAKRGTHLLKRQMEYYALLSERVFHLKAEDFSCKEACVMHIARFLPLITPMAKDSMYRSLHSYAAPSIKCFKSWNVAKQLSSEWIRANFVRKILQNIGALTPAVMSTREILVLLRLHGFSSPIEFPVGLLAKDDKLSASVPAVEDLVDFKSVDETLKNLREAETDLEEVDVVEDHEKHKNDVEATASTELLTVQTSGRDAACLLLPEDNPAVFRFIRETAEEIGVRYQYQELVPKVFYPSSVKVILRACKNLCELIIRKSFKDSYERLGRAPQQVNPADVYLTVQTNREFSLFSSTQGINFGQRNAS